MSIAFPSYVRMEICAQRSITIGVIYRRNLLCLSVFYSLKRIRNFRHKLRCVNCRNFCTDCGPYLRVTLNLSILSCNFMSCYFMSCLVMSCYFMPCYVMLLYVMPCCVMYFMSCYIMCILCHVISCAFYVMLYHVILCHVVA